MKSLRNVYAARESTVSLEDIPSSVKEAADKLDYWGGLSMHFALFKEAEKRVELQDGKNVNQLSLAQFGAYIRTCVSLSTDPDLSKEARALLLLDAATAAVETRGNIPADKRLVYLTRAKNILESIPDEERGDDFRFVFGMVVFLLEN